MTEKHLPGLPGRSKSIRNALRRTLNTFRRWPEEPAFLSVEEIIRAALKGKDIQPHNKTAIGREALFETSDYIHGDFHEKVRTSYQPNGYIIGIGFGSILSLLDCFPQDTDPKGLVVVDISPKVIASTRLFLEELRRVNTPDELVQEFFGQTLSPDYEKTYQAKLRQVLDKDHVFQKGYAEWETSDKPRTPKQIWEQRYSDMLSEQERNPWHYQIDPIGIALNNFDRLKRMVKDGKIAAIYADFYNPALVEAITALPDVTTSRNLIFTTNSLSMMEIFYKVDARSIAAPLATYEGIATTPLFISSELDMMSLQAFGSVAEMLSYVKIKQY